MIRALTAEQIRAAEHEAEAAGTSLRTLMERAGAALAAEVEARVPDGRVVVLAGAGNNGGDGWVAARTLHAEGRDVVVCALRDPSTLTAEAADAAGEAVREGVRWLVPEGAPADEISTASAVVDALLGIGASGPLRPPLPEWVAAVNESDALVFAADVPTGVDSDTGAVAGDAVAADVTVSFSAMKRGLVTAPGSAFAGEVVVVDIGVPAAALSVADAPEVWSAEEYAHLLPIPAPDAHKNSRGRVLVIAGSLAFPGAAILATRGAQRAGAGYVTLAIPHPAVRVAQAHLVSAPVVGMVAMANGAFSSKAAKPLIDLAAEYDAVVIGPGLTLADGAVFVVREVVRSLEKPLVIDADALNALAHDERLLASRKAPTIITPHPGEASRLLRSTPQAVQADRVSSARLLVGENRVVVLKGAGTVVADATRSLITTAGTSALATAGTGDVLSGVIGALAAQRLTAFDAAALGAWLHARAGEAAALELTPVCVTADDVPDFLPAAAAELLGWS